MSRIISSATSKLIGLFLSSLLLTVAILATAGSAAAQGTHTTQTVIEPFDIIVPAADSCSGEAVHVFGVILDTFQTTVDARGGVHLSLQFVPVLTGEGLTTGQIYLPKGPAHATMLDAPSGTSVFAATNVTRLIGLGSTANLMLTEHIHIIISPDGTVTVDRDYATFACRG